MLTAKEDLAKGKFVPTIESAYLTARDGDNSDIPPQNVPRTASST